jgi:hypothetical protein
MAPFQWSIGLLLAGLTACLMNKSPEWVTATVLGMIVLDLLAFVGVAIYFSIKSPDNLRSERHSISKLAIDRGLIGDNVRGLIANKAVQESLEAENKEPQPLLLESQQDVMEAADG